MAKTKTITVRAQIEKLLGFDIGVLPVTNPDRKSNQGNILFDVFCWQEVTSIAKKKLEAAWKVAQDVKGLVPDDDVLRKRYGAGEQIVAETDSFSCVVKLTEPRKAFDLETFIGRLAKKYKLDADELAELAENCKVDGKRSVSKKILEAA